MIRIFEYDIPENYRDFENYVFTNLNSSFVDIPNDKVTLDGVNYRLSSIVVLDEQESGQSTELPIIEIDFNDFVELMYFSNLETLTRYKFTYDLIGSGEQEYIFFAISKNSAEGNHGISMILTIDGRIVVIYNDENNDIIMTEIPIVFIASNDPETYIFEIGGIEDNLIFN